MKRYAVPMCLLLLAATAQASTRILTDSPGDQQLVIEDQSVPAVAGFDHLDLLGLSIDENETGLLLELEVAADPRNTQVRGVQDVTYLTHFTVEDQDYRVLAAWGTFPEDTPFFSANLQRYDHRSAAFEVVQQLTFSWSDQEPIVTILVPHSLLRNRADQLATQGDTITGFHVTSDLRLHHGLRGVYPLAGSDAMPDDGLGIGTWALKFGPLTNGTARLTAAQTYRVSNGEATTLLFPVFASNFAAHADDFDFTASNMPAAWQVSFPGDVLRLEPGATATVAILVTIPFMHEHGTFLSFDLRMQSRSDPLSFAELPLGVLYTEVAQPSGHHPIVHAHHLEDGRAIFNTHETFPNASAQPTGPRTTQGAGTGTKLTWKYSLEPALEMGIDADLNRTGLLSATFRSEVPITVSLRSEFVLSQPEGDPIILMETPETSLNLAAGQEMAVSAELRALAEADYVPFLPGNQLSWNVHATTATPMTAMPALISLVQANANLPLFDYHDEVTTAFTELTGLELRADDPQRVVVNPGETKVLRATLTSHGAAGKFKATITGQYAEWARIISDERFSLDADGMQSIAMAVAAPHDAAGLTADIFIHIENERDPSNRALVRFLVDVDASQDVEDDADLAKSIDGEHAKSSPGVNQLAVLVGLAAAFALRRRETS